MTLRNNVAGFETGGVDNIGGLRDGPGGGGEKVDWGGGDEADGRCGSKDGSEVGGVDVEGGGDGEIECEGRGEYGVFETDSDAC